MPGDGLCALKPAAGPPMKNAPPESGGAAGGAGGGGQREVRERREGPGGEVFRDGAGAQEEAGRAEVLRAEKDFREGGVEGFRFVVGGIPGEVCTEGEAVERAWRRFREGRTGFGPPFAVEVATTCGRTLGFR